jgi:hypothetical protein
MTVYARLVAETSDIDLYGCDAVFFQCSAGLLQSLPEWNEGIALLPRTAIRFILDG